MWRRVFDTVERAVGPGLQEVTSSTAFRDVVAAGSRVNSSIAKEVERSSRQWLHAWNLPAAGDVRSLRRQVAALEKEVRLLRSVVVASGPPTAAASPATSARRAPETPAGPVAGVVDDPSDPVGAAAPAHA